MMPEVNLFVGARITVLALEQGRTRGERTPTRGVTTKIHSDGRIAWRTETAIFGPWLRPHLEGIEWIRGHHNEQSDEIKALLAAAALVME